MNFWRARHRDALRPVLPAWKAATVQPDSCFEHGPFLPLHLFAPNSRGQLGFRGTPHPGPFFLWYLPYDCPGAWLPETPSFSSRIYPMMCSSCPQLKPSPDPVIMNAVEGFSWWWLLFCCLPRSLEVESLKALYLPASSGREQLPAGIKAGKVPENFTGDYP